MTTNYHTPIPEGAAANADTFNDPLGQMDEALSEALLEERDGHIIQEEGVDLAQQARLDFAGAGVTVTNEVGKTLVTIPGGATDHGTLNGLGDDDHPQYLLKTGLREWDEQGSDPSTPASTKWKLYFKSGGLYLIDDAGVVTGPLGVDGGGLPSGYLYGLTLSNNGTDPTNDIDIAPGKARDSSDAVDMDLASALTKRLDAAWAVGTNQGGLDTGSIANGTYHVWQIKRSDTGVVDVLFSTSASAPTMPANYDYKRRIGSIVRASGAIKLFVQDGDDFIWNLPVTDVNTTNPGTSAVTRTLTVPSGIRVKAKIMILGWGTSSAACPEGVFISDLSIADTSAATVFNLNVFSSEASTTQLGAMAECYTNTSAQVRSRIKNSAAGTGLFIQTHGWTDNRGRN